MASWTREAATECLQNNGFQIGAESRLGNDLGWRLTCAGGEIVNVYDTGKVVIQGKNQGPLKALFGQAAVPVSSGNSGVAPTTPGGNRNIFVVYGHDEKAKAELEAMLR